MREGSEQSGSAAIGERWPSARRRVERAHDARRRLEKSGGWSLSYRRSLVGKSLKRKAGSLAAPPLASSMAAAMPKASLVARTARAV